MSEFTKEAPGTAASAWHQQKPEHAAVATPTSTLGAIGSGLSMFGLGAMGMAPGLGAAASLSAGVFNHFADMPLGPMLAAATTPKKAYVDKDAKGKTAELVGLMDESRDVLNQNGVSKLGEEYLAGIMRNEGGRNGRRASIGSEFNRDAAALQKLDLEHVTDKQRKGLTGDQLALLSRAQAGTLDLKDPEAVKNAGIDIRTEQYSRMEELRHQDKRSKAEEAELRRLQGVKVAGGGRLDDFHGMSGDRFHEIFDEGQTRFELGQYKSFRKSFESQGKKPKKPGEDMTIHAGIGDATLDAGRQAKLNQNYDMLADYSTSYGTAQIMGLYGEQGKLTGKDGTGQNHTYSLDEMKQSAQRFSPNSEDVGMQLAFMNMKGIDMASPPSALSLATKYNGPKVAKSYAKKMLAGAADYRSARAAHDKETAGQ